MRDEFLTTTPWSNPRRPEPPMPVSARRRPLEAERPGPARSRHVTLRAVSKIAFGLFLLTNCVIFLRPSDWLPSLANWPIYQVMMVLTLLAWAPTFRPTRAMLCPITLCVLMLLPTVFLSHMTHMDTWDARYNTYEFAKKVIYFVMIIGLVTTPARLRTFLKWITPCIIGLTVLGLLQFHHLINFAALAAYQQNLLDQIDPLTGQVGIMERLCSMGIWHDWRIF